MKKISIKELWKQRQGSSLVLVLISMTFLTLLAMTIMAMTITNIRLKATEKRSQVNFYDTDAVMDSIKAGIENQSSQCSAEAYALALSEYSSSLASATVSLDQKYSDSYISKMVYALTGGTAYVSGTNTYQYSEDVMDSYLTDANVTAGVYKHHVSNQGDLVIDDGTILLKDFTILKSTDDYETKINTDIRIDVPAVNTEAHSEYLDYAILADNQILVDAVTAIVKGNIYAGTVNLWDGIQKPIGILVSNSGNLSVTGKNVITRGDITVDGGVLNVQGDAVNKGYSNVWVENLTTASETSGNQIDITGTVNVSDDTELNGDSDHVKIKGEYYGYNFSDDYTAPSPVPASNASYSSAISINGKDDVLDLSGLSTLELGGRTFISKKTNTDHGESSVTNPDIQLGESLSVKSNQLAYYIPSDFRGEATSYFGATPAEGTMNINGASEKVYYFSIGSVNYYFAYELFDRYIDVSGFHVKDYMDLSQPLQIYTRNDPTVAQDASGNGLVVQYFYLKFKDDETSSKYYDVFYNQSEREKVLDPVNASYLTDPGIIINEGKALYQTSGNILYQKASSGKLQLQLGTTTTGSNDYLTETAKNLSRNYLSMQWALIPDFADATSSGLWRLSSDGSLDDSKSGLSNKTNLFDRLIKRDAITGMVNPELKTTEDGQVVWISKGNIKWTTADKNNLGTSGILIATGDIEIQADFTGLIIAGGDVSISATGITVKSDTDKLEKLFEFDKSQAAPLFYDMFSQYFRKSVDATISDAAGGAVVDNVNYEKWNKNN